MSEQSSSSKWHEEHDQHSGTILWLLVFDAIAVVVVFVTVAVMFIGG